MNYNLQPQFHSAVQGVRALFLYFLPLLSSMGHASPHPGQDSSRIEVYLRLYAPEPEVTAVYLAPVPPSPAPLQLTQFESCLLGPNNKISWSIVMARNATSKNLSRPLAL